MTITTFEARAVAASLSLTLEILDDDHGAGLLTYRLLSLNVLLLWLGWLWEAASELTFELERWTGQAKRWMIHLRVRWQLVTIGLRAVCWGVCR